MYPLPRSSPLRIATGYVENRRFSPVAGARKLALCPPFPYIFFYLKQNRNCPARER
ncbi:hypothetical protein ERY430_70413 [Erythrobacter sp. EC-HK427]|nr:hypothetical protein ERY430_70413 [Erythrobacter sp. EC-HK427]